MGGVEVAAVGPADEDREIDRPEHRLIVGAVPQPDRPDGSPAHLVEAIGGSRTARPLSLSSDEVMETPAADDL